jgi:hypothetical protein
MSAAAWWLAGYTRGVQSGYEIGLREGDAALTAAALGFLGIRGPVPPHRRPSSKPLDTRTGPELVAAARASWEEA